MVDASVALKWVLKEGGTDEAMALWDRWQEAGERVLAPPIFRSEVTNALHQMVRRGHLGPYDATDLLEALLAVVAVEDDEAFTSEAQSLLVEHGDNVVFHEGALAQGAAEHGPYDAIVIEGGVAQLPEAIPPLYIVAL